MGKGDTCSSHGGSKKKRKERMAEVQPVWTKYFEDTAAAGGEDDARGGGDASLETVVETEEENSKIAACQFEDDSDNFIESAYVHDVNRSHMN